MRSPLSVLFLASFVMAGSTLAAQIGGDGSDGDLVVTKDQQLSSDKAWQFRSISVAAYATLTFSGKQPAVVRCQGNVEIHGRISVDASSTPPIDPFVPGPGGFAGGNPRPYVCSSLAPPAGSGPGGGQTQWQIVNAELYVASAVHGKHRGVYGSDYPFSLTGGSGGSCSGMRQWFRQGSTWVCGVLDGGAGGGALAILADGSIVVRGIVSARGSNHLVPIYAAGASGSILLRSMRELRVESGGVVDAGGWSPGYVRLDAYGAAPVIVGQVGPAPEALALPHLRLMKPPKLNGTMVLSLAALPGDLVAVFFSWGQSRIPIPPYGTLELDPAVMIFAGGALVPTNSIDPMAPLEFPVHGSESLIGRRIYMQGVNTFTSARSRLTNMVSAVFER